MGKLTARGCESRAKRKGRFSDGDGLHLRVIDPGHKVYWVFRFRINGREREASVGAYPAVSLAEARAKHAEMRAMVLRGIDPLAGRRGGVAVTTSGTPTFAAMALKHVAAHEGAWRSSKHSRQYRATLDTYCAPLKDVPVDQVTTQTILACLEPIWNEKPETASRVRARIEAVIASAQVDGWIPEDRPNPARWKNWLDRKLPNPRKVGKPRGHHTAMPYADVPEFVAKLAEIDTVAARALQFLILTACCTGEVLGARWSEISFETAIWSIPKERMKMGREHQVPLAQPALDILRGLHEARGDNPFVFAGRPQRPLSGMSCAMLMRRMKVPVTVHGMRAAARSWMAAVAHAPFELCEACLAHSVGNQTVAAYMRDDLLERRRPLMTAWSNHCCGTGTSNVVPFRLSADEQGVIDVAQAREIGEI